jgi:aminopeptidase N
VPLSDPFFHVLFLGRRAALDCPAFEPFPPGGRKPWKANPAPRRDLDFHVRHYRVELNVDVARKELRGRAALTIEAVGDALGEAVLDASEMTIASVRAGARSLAHSVGGGRLRVSLPRPLAAGRRLTLVIEYATRPRKGFWFVGPTEAEPDREPSGWSQGQADDTHYWIPCLESQESRATLEMIATVPRGYRAIGNGRLISRRVSGRRGTVTYRWRQDTPHPAYLTSLVVGKYVELKDRAGKTPLFHYVRRGREAEARRLLGKTARMIATFSKTFGVPYPYPKYAQSTVYDFTYGGMENTSATTLTERALQKPGESIDQSYESLISHELSHQWWGDLVTCRDWSEGWLNEGFATYSEVIFLEADAGRDEADFARLEQMCSYLVEDGGEYRRPIVETRYDYPSDIFDRHLYEKGACVAHMLRTTLGEAAWKRALRLYLARHAFAGVETSDLRRACEEASGKNLSWFFEQWIHRGGHPELRVDRSWDAERSTLRLTLEQVQAEEGASAAFRLPLTLEVVAGAKRMRFPLDLRERRETIQIPLPARPRYVALDPEHSVLKFLEFPRSDEELLYGLSRSPHVLERIRCARELSPRGDRAVVRALLAALRRDRFWGVRVAAAASLGEIGRRGTPGIVETLAASLRAQPPRVRRAIVWALGLIGGDAAQKHLRRAAGDQSAFAAGTALLGLARAGAPGAFEALQEGLGRESHRDLLKVLIFEGMAKLKDLRAVAVLLEHAGPRHRNEAREGAVRALGVLGILSDPVESRLIELLRDPWFRVRTAAARSLAKLKAPRAAQAIRDALREEIIDTVRSAFEGALVDLGASG